MAEGFLHDFEGWVIFMACTACSSSKCGRLQRLEGRRALWESIQPGLACASQEGTRRVYPFGAETVLGSTAGVGGGDGVSSPRCRRAWSFRWNARISRSFQ